jgi:hypothetical protein
VRREAATKTPRNRHITFTSPWRKEPPDADNPRGITFSLTRPDFEVKIPEICLGLHPGFLVLEEMIA